MKKIYLIVQKKNIASTVEDLRESGIVHVEHQEPLGGEQLEELRDRIDQLQNAVGILKQQALLLKGQKEILSSGQEQFLNDYEEKVSEILLLASQIEHAKESVAKRQIEINQWEKWGDFNPQDFEALAQKGIYVYLCEIPATEQSKIPSQTIVHIIQKEKGTLRCVLISNEKLNFDFKMLSPPSMSLNQMKSLQQTGKENIQRAQESLKNNIIYLKPLEKIFKEEENLLRFEEVIVGSKEEGTLAYLKGFCPVDSVATLQEYAKKKGWVLALEDPAEGDAVPTLLRNPKWVEMIKPVFNFMNSIPGYRELDISFFFLLFLSIFFGILIGDAAYGILFIALTAFAHKKLGQKNPDHSVFYLIYTMSSFAVVWGVLTGTFFGTKLFGSVIKPLMPWLTVNEHVQLVCFILGSVHLTIAHTWRAMLRLNSVTALAELGWIIIVWACFFFVRMLILNQPLPSFINLLLIIGPGLVILFNQPRKNILAAIGLGLGDFLLNVMSFFGDVVSYIRLFAVGLAGVAVADAFNQMALAAGFENLLTGLLAIFVLLVGHALNMILACFGVLVHGVRLNLLEFSAHLGMEWSGAEYNPFRKSK